jgi:hypothetical protein
MSSPEAKLDIRPGAYYSNGAYGRSWGVRWVESVGIDPESGETMLAFKGAAGACRRKTGHCPLAAFAEWARYEVALNENSWQRVGSEAAD